MTIHALVTGTLRGAPVASTSKNGRAYTRATLAITDSNERRYVTLFVFGDTAQAELARRGDGDALSVQGPLKAELYEPSDGPARVSLSIYADHVLALRQPPKEKKKKDAPNTPAAAGPRTGSTTRFRSPRRCVDAWRDLARCAEPSWHSRQ